MPETAERIYIRKDAHGRIALDQGEINGHCISFNPDTERFHVHAKGEHCETIATFSKWFGATAFARRK